jgi:hypothetical protein
MQVFSSGGVSTCPPCKLSPDRSPEKSHHNYLKTYVFGARHGHSPRPKNRPKLARQVRQLGNQAQVRQTPIPELLTKPANFIHNQAPHPRIPLDTASYKLYYVNYKMGLNSALVNCLW